MALRKIPVVATPIGLKDLFFKTHSLERSYTADFEKAVADVLGQRYCFLINSGKASFYIILKALSKLSGKKEVILPAYTDAGLILPLKRLGLKPVICDVSLETFNLDENQAANLISKDVLCVVAVHMFGLACDLKQIDEIAKERDIIVIEDGAQAFGTKIEGKMAGTIEDIGFYSFNRGKNLPTYGGGCITTNSEKLAKIIESQMKELREPSSFFNLTIPFKLFALSLTVRPGIYGILYPFTAHFKSNRPPSDFDVFKYSDFQAKIGLSLLEKIDEFSKRRYINAMALIKGLQDMEGVILPEISQATEPAFNRLPVVFEDFKKRETVERNLWKTGIETSRMYLKPLHHRFDLGYKRGDFPNATYFAEHLLTLPVHPLVRQEDLSRMIDVIRSKG